MATKVVKQKLYIWRFDGDIKIDNTNGMWASNDGDFEEKLRQELEEDDVSRIPYCCLMDESYKPITRNIELAEEEG